MSRTAQRAVESHPAVPPAPASPASSAPAPLARCFLGDGDGSPPRPLDALLDRAADRFDGGDFQGSLACAEEAARVEPQSVEAHHLRADALRELDRLPEARDAFEHALALDPDDPRTLDGIADFFINRLPATNDHMETGLAYARRGTHKSRRLSHALRAHLALLEGEALSDLGRSREALSRLDAALALLPDEPRALYEKAVAEFELCRFADTRRDLQRVLALHPEDAAAHNQLGLVLEWLGDPGGAERELARARTLAPEDYKPPVLPSPAEFRALVDAEAAKLPPSLRQDLAQVRLEVADLPDLSDLIAEEPPLSPTILGLFRGVPLGDCSTSPDDEARTIVIYRKNLGRAVTSHDELVTQIRTTLLHELGHLRGEDDDDLRARGLE